MSAVRSETKAVRSFTKSIKSVMGITSHQMEGAARHMELPSTTVILSNCSYKYEYMFANYSGCTQLKAQPYARVLDGRAGRFHVRTGAYPYGNVVAYVTSGS